MKLKCYDIEKQPRIKIEIPGLHIPQQSFLVLWLFSKIPIPIFNFLFTLFAHFLLILFAYFLLIHYGFDCIRLISCDVYIFR